MSARIHKHRISALGLHRVDGHARTIGTDPDGDLAVWFETDVVPSHFWVLFTGEEVPWGARVISTTTHDGLVYHLAVSVERGES